MLSPALRQSNTNFKSTGQHGFGCFGWKSSALIRGPGSTLNSCKTIDYRAMLPTKSLDSRSSGILNFRTPRGEAESDYFNIGSYLALVTWRRRVEHPKRRSSPKLETRNFARQFNTIAAEGIVKRDLLEQQPRCE